MIGMIQLGESVEAELAQKLVAGLKQAGIDLVTYLPETRLSQILPLLRSDPAFTLVPVASESEAVTIGAGAALAGKQVAIYMECTGLYVSCYTLVSIASRYGVPLLLVVAYLGSMADQRNNQFTRCPELMSNRCWRRYRFNFRSSRTANGSKPISKTRCVTCTLSSCLWHWCLPENSPDDPL